MLEESCSRKRARIDLPLRHPRRGLRRRFRSRERCGERMGRVAEAVAGRCVERMEGAVVSAWDVAEAVVECSIRH